MCRLPGLPALVAPADLLKPRYPLAGTCRNLKAALSEAQLHKTEAIVRFFPFPPGQPNTLVCMRSATPHYTVFLPLAVVHLLALIAIFYARATRAEFPFSLVPHPA